MKELFQTQSFNCFKGIALKAFNSILFIFSMIGIASNAQPNNSLDIPAEREIHNTFSTNEGGSSILDATNPMELLNRLRNATAMDNATEPSDAIDEALKALEKVDADSSI